MKKFSSLTYLAILLVASLSSHASEIHNAASKGDIEGVRKALAKGEEVVWLASNPSDKYEWPKGTALHWSVNSGHIEIVKLLIEKGSDINKRTYAGDSRIRETPLEIAAYKNNYEIAKLLLDSGANIEGSGQNFFWPLYSASKIGNIKLIQLFIKSGANLNRTGVDGYSAIHVAIEKKQIKAIKFLLENKFNPNLVGMHDNIPMGSTPLQFAKEKGNKEIINLLQSHGAK